MASNERFSLNFQFSEFRGWEDATEGEKEKARDLSVLILQPIRRRFGRVHISSWLRRGSEAHGLGDAVDFVALAEVQRELAKIPEARRLAAPETTHRQAQEMAHKNVVTWAATHLIASRVIGEIIAERDHVHVTLWDVGGRGQVLHEDVEGTYTLGGTEGALLVALVALSFLFLAVSLLGK